MSTSRVLASIAVLAAFFCAAACGGKKIKAAKPPRIGATEQGIASWYGHPYHGRRAANGEIYDNTWVRVTNLSNHRAVDVRIQDRGPFVNGRIIDLSRAAARQIEMIGPGTTKVRITVIRPPADIQRQPELYAVQVGAFRERRRAETLEAQMKDRFGTARLVERAVEPPIWRVLVGEEETPDQAEGLAARIRSSGAPAFVVRLDEALP
jgi:rare lipoprotein A